MTGSGAVRRQARRVADEGEQGRRRHAGALDVAALLREARGRARPRLSQRDLARAAGVAPSTLAQLESGKRTGVTLETFERLLAAAGFQLDAALVPLGDDVDRAADELARTGLDRRVLELPFFLAPAILDLQRARVDFVVSGRTAALLQGVPVQPTSLDLLVTRAQEDRLAQAIRRMGAPRWDGQLFGYCSPDPRHPGHDRWRLGGGELRLRWVEALPASVTVVFQHQDDMGGAAVLGLWEGPDPDPVAIAVPVLPLPLLELDDPRAARALARVLARLAFRA